MSKLKDNKIISYIAITIGVAISIFSQNYFLLPNQISTGGFSGIATILYYLFGLPVGITMLVLNVPLFLVSFKKLGSGFVLRSLYAMVMYSLLTDLFPIRPLTEDMLLASIYGGVLMGLGLGISVYFGGSTGGTGENTGGGTTTKPPEEHDVDIEIDDQSLSAPSDSPDSLLNTLARLGSL